MDNKDVKDLMSILANITSVMALMEDRLNQVEAELGQLKEQNNAHQTRTEHHTRDS
jgi:hypothetical protein